MAQIGRAGLLQLLRGTREPRELGRVPGPIAGAVVANSSSPEPATPPTVDPDACAGSTMATSTARAPSLSRSSLRRQSSEIRTGCANERPSGSGEGVASNHDPYSDPLTGSRSGQWGRFGSYRGLRIGEDDLELLRIKDGSPPSCRPPR